VTLFPSLQAIGFPKNLNFSAVAKPFVEAPAPAIDGPDCCGHFSLFRFSSDAILTKALNCQTCDCIARNAIHYIFNRVTLDHTAIHYIFNGVTVLPSLQAIGFPNNFNSSAVAKPFFLGWVRQWSNTSPH
jgi:hypothetical protein